MLVHEDDSRRFDVAQVGADGRNHGVEPAFGTFRHGAGTRFGATADGGIRLDYDDLPAGELQRPGVDPGKPELEHATWAVSQQLEDLRRRGGGESRGQSAHRYARYMNEKRTGKFLGLPYDLRRPTVARLKSRWWNREDHRIFTPKTFGWGYDINLAEVGRRLRLRR